MRGGFGSAIYRRSSTKPILDQDGELLPFIDSTNLVVSLGLEEGLGQNVITQEVEQFKPPALGTSSILLSITFDIKKTPQFSPFF